MVEVVKVPGKVMLSGEYAVLFGGTAVLVPVDRYLVVSEGVAIAQAPPPVVKHALEIPIPALDEYERNNSMTIPTIDNRAFYCSTDDGKQKLGIGSSAAEAIGVVAWRFGLAGIDWRERRSDVIHYAMQAHYLAQHELGSGADVAACGMEAPIYFRIENGDPIINPVQRIPRRTTPLALAWSGQSADTRLLVKRFMAWANDGGARTTDLIDRLVALSHELAPCWFMATSEQLYQLLGQYTSTLNLCVKAAGLQYRFGAQHDLSNWAVSHGGKAKPVGAGGGDMVLLVGHLPLDELDAMTIRLSLQA